VAGVYLVVIGYRLQAGRAGGSVDGVRITYETGGALAGDQDGRLVSELRYCTPKAPSPGDACD
jgi:hypothetical protein